MVSFKCRRVELALHKVGQGYESESGSFKAENNTKLIFKIDSNLISFRQGLIDKGVIVRDLKLFEGYPSLFCDGEDPEGNVFQIEEKLNK